MIELVNDIPELSKRIYTGQWKDGMKDSQGTYVFYDQFGNIKYKYIGGFKEGRFFGKGTHYTYDRNGNITKTQSGWWDDKFLGEK